MEFSFQDKWSQGNARTESRSRAICGCKEFAFAPAAPEAVISAIGVRE
jgi:hypothetical protein